MDLSESPILQPIPSPSTRSRSDSSSSAALEVSAPPGIKYDPQHGIRNPSPNDIICGRGKMTIAHPGNRRFRQLVSEKKGYYQKAKRRDDKTRITFDLVQTLRHGPGGGRFLLYDPNTNLWYDVGDEYAREKVSHSLRSRPSDHRRNSGTNKTNHSTAVGSASHSASDAATKPKPRKRMVQKPTYSPAIEAVVQRLIQDQQSLLMSMISKESPSALGVQHSPNACNQSTSQSSSPLSTMAVKSI